MLRIRRSLVAVLACSTLFGCSSEPSSSDIESEVQKKLVPALEQQFKMQADLAGTFNRGVKPPIPKLQEVNKVGCKPDGEKAFSCDVELVIVAGDKKENKVLPMRFVKGSSGWIAQDL